MKKQITLFRILTFILLPIALLFGLIAVFFLMNAMVNYSALLPTFLFSCMVIYCFASLSFLTKGIDRGMPCKPSLRDWIRVNAFVSIFTGGAFLLQSLGIFFMGPNMLRDLAVQMQEMQSLPTTFSPELFVSALKIAAGFMLFVSVILLVHLFLNFRLMKAYRHLFMGPGNS